MPALEFSKFQGQVLALQVLELFEVEPALLLDGPMLFPLLLKLVLGGYVGLCELGQPVLEESVLGQLGREVVVEPLVLDGELPVHAVDFVDFVFELEAQGDFLVEGLFCLLEVLHKHVLVVLEGGVVLAEFLEFLENLGVLLLVVILVAVDDALPLFNFGPHALHLLHLVAFYFCQHGLEVAVGTVLQQDRKHLPKRLADVHVLPPHFFQQRVEPHRVHKQRPEYPLQVLRLYPFREQRVLVDPVLLQRRVLDSQVELLIVAVLEQYLIEPVLDVLVLDLALLGVLPRFLRKRPHFLLPLPLPLPLSLLLLQAAYVPVQYALIHTVELGLARIEKAKLVAVAELGPPPHCSCRGKALGREFACRPLGLLHGFAQL